MRALALCVLAVALASPVAAETPIPPPPAQWVTDQANWLSPPARAELNGRLQAYQQASGHQVLVYIDRTTGGVPIEDWAVRAFERWRVGRRGIDDGVVLFLFTDDRRVRLEVGYGLEATLPDLRAGRIIETQITPRLRAGDKDGAVRAGVEAVIATLGGGGVGQPVAQPGVSQLPHLPWWMWVAGAVVLMALLGFLATHPALAVWLIYTIGSGHGGGGWGPGGRGGGGWGRGGGGGFSGGGGRSGGGGASGSW